MALFRLTSNGKSTIMELDGKTIGHGVEAVSFTHNINADKRRQIMLHIDMALDGGFEFMEDGRYDEISQLMMEPSSNDEDDGSSVDKVIAATETMRDWGSIREH